VRFAVEVVVAGFQGIYGRDSYLESTVDKIP